MNQKCLTTIFVPVQPLNFNITPPSICQKHQKPLSYYNKYKPDNEPICIDCLISETKEEERIQSEFGCMSKALPITSSNLQKACEAAKRDVAWIKDEAGADKIEAQLSATNAQRVQLEIDIQKDAATIAGGIYETQWQEAVR